MSFMEGLGKMAEGLMGGDNPLAGVDPQQAAAAASDHVQNLDPSELAGHLTQSVGSMDATSLVGLGQTLLQGFTNNAGFQGDGAAAAQAAGTDAQAVAAGSPNAVSALINFATSHPQVLQGAAGSFLQNNPAAIGQLSPGLLGGILGKLGVNL